MSERVKLVITYLYENLKGLKNPKILMQLRLLCISIQRWDHAFKLEELIMSLITDPFLKVLKMTEFVLF